MIKSLPYNGKIYFTSIKLKSFIQVKRLQNYLVGQMRTKKQYAWILLKKFLVFNTSTSNVYYKRQLSVFSFNIHILLTSQSVFYTYPETNGRKGSDEVCLTIYHFNNFLLSRVRVLDIFCDSSREQNKNYSYKMLWDFFTVSMWKETRRATSYVKRYLGSWFLSKRIFAKRS